MMQYLFQNMNFRGEAKAYQDLLRSIATEEMGHVELVSNTINMLLEGASKQADPEELPLGSARPWVTRRPDGLFVLKR